MFKKKPKAPKEAVEGGKKKKGKLPVIIALVVVLGGGGFFMMKGNGGKEKPKVKIGAEVAELGEVLVNLKGGSTYARMNIGLQFVEGFDVAHLEKQKAVIRDAIIMVVSARSVGDISSPTGKELLKELIATSINHSLHLLHPPEASEKAQTEAPKEDAHGAEKNHDDGEDNGVPRAKRAHPEWDSDEGPVLKVYFSDFVTQ